MANPAAPAVVKAAAAAPVDHLPAWLDFWSKVIGSAIWPLTVLVLAVIFAGPLRRLITKLTQFKGWGVEAAFAEGLVKLADQAGVSEPAPALPPPSQEDVGGIVVQGDEANATPAQDVSEKPRARRTSEGLWEILFEGSDLLDPAAAVADAWRRIEVNLRVAAIKRGLFPGTNPADLPRNLMRAGAITPQTYDAIKTARELANRVRHTGEATPSEAALYIASVNSILTRVRTEAGISPDIPQKQPDSP